MGYTKNEAKQLAQSTERITRRSSGGRTEVLSSYEEMMSDLNRWDTWQVAQFDESQVLLSTPFMTYIIHL